MYKKNFLVFITIILFSISLHAQSKIVWSEKKDSYLKYTMHHSLHDFSGVDDKANCVVSVNPSGYKIEKVSVSSNLSDFNSGSSNRDSHVLEATDALKYPKIKFNSNNITKEGNHLKIVGNLSFHGVTKEKVIYADEEIKNNKLIVKGSFDVKQTEFGITPETFMMVPVDDLIKMEFLMTFPSPSANQ